MVARCQASLAGDCTSGESVRVDGLVSPVCVGVFWGLGNVNEGPGGRFDKETFVPMFEGIPVGFVCEGNVEGRFDGGG